MKDFYSTIGGRRLCDATLPEIARQLKRVADEMKRANNLKERELKAVRGLSLSEEAKAFMEGYEKTQPEDEEADFEGDASLHALDT